MEKLYSLYLNFYNKDYERLDTVHEIKWSELIKSKKESEDWLERLKNIINDIQYIKNTVDLPLVKNQIDVSAIRYVNFTIEQYEVIDIKTYVWKDTIFMSKMYDFSDYLDCEETK